MRLSCAGSFASAFQKLLTQSTPRVRMMSSYTAFTSALASEYSMSVTSDTLPSIGFGYINNVIEWLAGLDPQVLLLGFAVLGIALALPLVVVALGRLRRLRLAGSAFYLLLGGFLALLGVAAGLTAASLRTYQRLTHEQLAARVSIRQLGERHFALTLQPPAETPRQFEVRGDEWQIDARVLKWRGLATLAGFDTVYRLDRLSGRYADTAQQRRAPRGQRLALAAGRIPRHMKFLFDLLPVVLFFAAFKLWDIYVATAVAIAATFVQVGWLKLAKRRVEPMLWASLGIIAVFGGATLLLQDETFIKWKPTVLYWLLGAVLAGAALLFRRNLIRSMLSEKVQLPETVWSRLNWSWIGFFAFMGAANLYVAYNYSTDLWVNFKLFGGMGLMLVFVVAQALFLAKYVEEKQ